MVLLSSEIKSSYLSIERCQSVPSKSRIINVEAMFIGNVWAVRLLCCLLIRKRYRVSYEYCFVLLATFYVAAYIVYCCNIFSIGARFCNVAATTTTQNIELYLCQFVKDMHIQYTHISTIHKSKDVFFLIASKSICQLYMRNCHWCKQISFMNCIFLVAI